jgi:hypothetical protein
MSTVDMSFATDAATLADIQSQLAQPGLDPIKKAILEVQETQLVSQIKAKATAAANAMQNTNTFIEQYQLGQMLGGIGPAAATLATAIASAFGK